jgi:hypothetical protein
MRPLLLAARFRDWLDTHAAPECAIEMAFIVVVCRDASRKKPSAQTEVGTASCPLTAAHKTPDGGAAQGVPCGASCGAPLRPPPRIIMSVAVTRANRLRMGRSRVGELKNSHCHDNNSSPDHGSGRYDPHRGHSSLHENSLPSLRLVHSGSAVPPVNGTTARTDVADSRALATYSTIVTHVVRR